MASVEDIQRKLDDIYEDLEHNVIKIFKRRNMLIAMDIVWHSPLHFKYCGAVKKAYPEVLILGDTRCGKSEMADRLAHHYRQGAIASCEGSSFAGMVGGLETIAGNKWVTKWGQIPRNTGRLLVLDEVSGLSVDDIGKMSSMRSSGIAELNKIRTERVNAKTRLIWLSNPRVDERSKSRKSMRMFTTGVEAIEDLIGRQEDIARFDFAVLIGVDEVSSDDMHNSRKRTDVPHNYTSDIAEKLIMWCWSRSADQVVYSQEVFERAYECSTELVKKYSSDCPLIAKAEQQMKLLRMAGGLAGRLFSCDETGDKLVIKVEHVEFVHKYIQEVYDAPIFGFDKWSDNMAHSRDIEDPARLRVALRGAGKVSCEHLMHMKNLNVNSLADLLGKEIFEARMVLKELVETRAMHNPFGKYYVKTPAFIDFLRGFLEEADAFKPIEQEY